MGELTDWLRNTGKDIAKAAGKQGGAKMVEKRRMIRHEPLRFPDEDWGKISQEAKDFCQALMEKKPKDRLSAERAKV